MIKSKHKIIRPKPGDLFISKKTLDILDSKGVLFTLKQNETISLVSISDLKPSMRLDRYTKFIANWKCKFFYDRRLFELTIINSASDSSFFAHFEPLTEELANKLSSPAETEESI